MAGLVPGHLVDGVMDGVQIVLLGQLGQLELAQGGAVLGLDPHLQVLLGGVGHDLAQQLGELGGVLGLLIGGLLPVQAEAKRLRRSAPGNRRKEGRYRKFLYPQVDIFTRWNLAFCHKKIHKGDLQVAKQNDAGVYKLKNGNWAYRYVLMVNGVRKEVRKAKDEFGAPFKTKREAIKARQAAIDSAQNSRKPKPTVRKTVQEVYQEYCANGRSDRAYTTKRKQDSLWKNHLCTRFGERYIDEISAAEVVDYLTELYCSRGLSYRYVEGFLKMFYLLFGQAYSRNYLDVDSYNKLCVNKDTKIHMPKLKTDDDLDIVSFNREELAVLDDYFHGTNAETAYLLGRYCGLRINECYGLKWSNVDLINSTILIDRQMQYQQGRIKLVSLKTRNAKRTIQMCDKLKVYFQNLAKRREQDQLHLADLREQNQRIIEDLDGSKISSTELVNCLPDGKIQTVNSMKFHTREVKAKCGIMFKYHYLRHTYGTMMAELNTPQHLLCSQMGHGHIQVTQRYYIALSGRVKIFSHFSLQALA